MLKNYRFVYLGDRELYNDYLEFLRTTFPMLFNNILFATPIENLSLEKEHLFWYLKSSGIVIPECKVLEFLKFKIGIFISIISAKIDYMKKSKLVTSPYVYHVDYKPNVDINSDHETVLLSVVDGLEFNIETEKGLLFSEYMPVSGYDKKIVYNAGRLPPLNAEGKITIDLYNYYVVSDYSALLNRKFEGFDTLKVIFRQSVENINSLREKLVNFFDIDKEGNSKINYNYYGVNKFYEYVNTEPFNYEKIAYVLAVPYVDLLIKE